MTEVGETLIYESMSLSLKVVIRFFNAGYFFEELW